LHWLRARFQNIWFLDNLYIGLFGWPLILSGQLMSRTLQSSRHQALKDFLVEKRKKAGLTQAEVAKKLRRYQSFVATVEGGQRKIDVVELLAFAEAIGFDPREAIKRLSSVKPD
jgi:hypothetical protein